MSKLTRKGIVAVALLVCLIFAVGFYSVKDSKLPNEVDRALKRNGIERYTVLEENPKNEFNDLLLKDNFTSFNIIDENENKYFVAYDDVVNNILILDKDNKMVEGFIDDTMIPVEHFNKFLSEGK